MAWRSLHAGPCHCTVGTNRTGTGPNHQHRRGHGGQRQAARRSRPSGVSTMAARSLRRGLGGAALAKPRPGIVVRRQAFRHERSALRRIDAQRVCRRASSPPTVRRAGYPATADAASRTAAAASAPAVSGTAAARRPTVAIQAARGEGFSREIHRIPAFLPSQPRTGTGAGGEGCSARMRLGKLFHPKRERSRAAQLPENAAYTRGALRSHTSAVGDPEVSGQARYDTVERRRSGDRLNR